jgi:hypothetical protein
MCNPKQNILVYSKRAFYVIMYFRLSLISHKIYFFKDNHSKDNTLHRVRNRFCISLDIDYIILSFKFKFCIFTTYI